MLEIMAVEEPDDVADDVCDAVAIADCDAEEMPDAVGVSEPSRDQYRRRGGERRSGSC